MNTALARLNAAIQRVLVALLGTIIVALVLVVLWGVATRFLFVDPSRWTEETARLLMIWMTMIGAAVADARREHLGVDYVVAKLDPAARRPVLLVAELCVVAFAASAMVYGGGVLMTRLLDVGQWTPALGIRMGWVYAAVPIAGVTIVLSGIERILGLVTGDPTELQLTEHEAASPD
jgi:TRAP-type C4-dicarboxylate transport system permease small subunit